VGGISSVIMDNVLCCVGKDDPAVSDYALDGLKQIMAVKSRVVLPYLVPQVSLAFTYFTLFVR